MRVSPCTGMQKYSHNSGKKRPPNFPGSLRSRSLDCSNAGIGVKKGDGLCRPLFAVALLVEFELERYRCSVIQVDGVSVSVTGSQVTGGQNELPSRGACAVQQGAAHECDGPP